MDPSCIFCKIIAKQFPSNIVYENDHIVVFLDANPIHPGHTLIVPREHYVDMTETPSQVLADMMVHAKDIGIALLKNGYADGFNIGVNTKPASGQAVFHTHLHVIPRKTGDGLKHWPKQKDVTPDEMKKIRETLSAALR